MRKALAWFSVLVLAASALVAAAPAAADTPADRSGASELGSCLNSAPDGVTAGDVLLLMDNSLSLTQPGFCDSESGCDPEAARITGAEELVKALVAHDYSVNVGVATFGGSFNSGQAVAWTPLNQDTLESVITQLRRLPAPNELFTNYEVALEGAKRAVDQQRDASGAPCRAIVWFSDGNLDVDNDGTFDQEERDARQRICQAGGLADMRLRRSSEIIILGIGLNPTDSTFDVMRDISTGSGDCGPQKDLYPMPGDFVHVRDINDLILKLIAWGLPGSTTTDFVPTAICLRGQDENADCRHQFVLDDSIHDVVVTIYASTVPVTAFIMDPSGNKLEFSSTPDQHTDRLGTASVTWHWVADGMVTATLSGSGDGWNGPWQIWFVSDAQKPGESRGQVSIRSLIVPRWSSGRVDPVHSGELLKETRVYLMNRVTGAVIDPATLQGKAALTVELTLPTGERTTLAQLDKKTISDPLPIDLTDVAPGQGAVNLTLVLTTKDWTSASGVIPGTTLEPSAHEEPLDIESSSGLKVHGPIEFGYVDPGAVEAEATVTVTGAGCVWLDETRPLASIRPDSLQATVSSTHSNADTCLRVTYGEEAQLPLKLTLPQPAEEWSEVTGQLNIRLAPPAALDADVEPVNFNATLQPLPSTPTTIWAVVVCLVLGAGVPYLLSYLIRRQGAVIPPTPLECVSIPVEINNDWIGRGERFDQDLAVRTADRSTAAVTGHPQNDSGSRSLTLPTGVSLRTHVPWSPYSSPAVRVEAPGQVGASSADNRPGRHRAVLPLDLGGSWFLLVDPAELRNRATAHFLLAYDATPDQVNVLVGDFKNRAPDIHRALRKAADSLRPASPEDGPHIPDDPSTAPDEPWDQFADD
jgi:hypothetical protein